MDLTTPIETMTADSREMLPRSLPSLVQIAAAASPSAIAVQCGAARLTYRELVEGSDAVAAAILQALGTAHAREAVVGLLVPRGTQAFVGMLGIMKAGATYLPFDLDQPAGRVAFMLEDSEAVLLLGTSGAEAAVPVLDLSAAMACGVAAGKLPEIGPRDAAYVIYTSGSTGRPKGVVVEHRSAVNLALCHRDLFGLQPDSRGLQFASLTFDASISETFSAFAAGATLLVAEDRERRDPVALVDLLEREGVTVATLPPSLLPHLPSRDLPELATVVVAGEVCAGREMVRWASGRRLINAYGPTEASVCATASLYRPGDPPSRIGTALPGVTLHVLDEAMAPVPPGNEGELYIGGIGVARGYLNRPELTRERFVESDHVGGRAFRSGDRVRTIEPGVLEFLGRLDDQIKIASHRIEPDEVARALEAADGIRQACVVVRDDEHGRRLAAFYVPDEPAPSAKSLEEILSRWLPPYMLPAEYIALPALPLTTSGKIDRAALLLVSAAAPDEEIPALTPMEEAVAQVWREVLDVPTIRSTDNFYALGGDSLRMTQLLLRLNQTFGTMLVASRFRKLATLGDLAGFIERQSQPAPAAAAG